MCEEHPDVPAGSSNQYANWEVVDPEKWVPDGYAIVRVDSRGAGRSPGVVDIWSPREAQDYYDCIEWAAKQPWSSGKVGLNGISYFAMNQWQVAAMQPPHLAAICAWEGAADYYRDLTFHGGIYCPSRHRWFPSQVLRVQHGRGTNGLRSSMTGEWVSGPETLTDEELGSLRHDWVAEAFPNKLATDKFWTERMPDWSKVTVPLVVGGELGRPGPASARQFRRLRARRLERQMAGGARLRALDLVLHRLRRDAAEALLRPLPQGRGHRLGQTAEGAAASAPSRRAIRRARRG